MKSTAPRLTPTRRRLRLARQARPLYLVPTRLPRLRPSRSRWYRELAELIVGLLLVLAAAGIVSRMVPWL